MRGASIALHCLEVTELVACEMSVASDLVSEGRGIVGGFGRSVVVEVSF